MPGPKPIEVEAKDKAGQPLGFVFHVKPNLVVAKDDLSEQPSLRRLRHIARNLEGWSSMKLDGERYTFSQQRAIELMSRFPHLAQQIEEMLPDHKEIPSDDEL